MSGRSEEILRRSPESHRDSEPQPRGRLLHPQLRVRFRKTLLAHEMLLSASRGCASREFSAFNGLSVTAGTCTLVWIVTGVTGTSYRGMFPHASPSVSMTFCRWSSHHHPPGRKPHSHPGLSLCSISLFGSIHNPYRFFFKIVRAFTIVSTPH